jgi:hypothetical protein
VSELIILYSENKPKQQHSMARNKQRAGFISPILPGYKALRPAINTKPIAPVGPQVGTTSIIGNMNSPKPIISAKEQTAGAKRKGRVKTINAALPTASGTLAGFLSVSKDDSSSSSDSFEVANNRTLFYDDARSAPVTFDMSLVDTTCVMPLERVIGNNTSSTGLKGSKFMINLASFARGAADTGTSTAGYPVYDHYRTLYSSMSKTVMATIRSKLIDSFSFNNFYNYINKIGFALEMYYSLDAILSYRSDTDDKNAGVIELQSKLSTSEIYNAQNELRRNLKGYWFPEKYSQLIRWIYQIYKTSNNYQACNYVFSPCPFYIYDAPSTDISAMVVTVLDSINTDLSNSADSETFAKISSVLGQTYPNGLIRGFPLSSNTACYNPQHYEIFVNQPVWYSLGAGTEPQHYPDASLGNNIVYARDCNPGERSGLPFVLQNVLGGTDTIDFFRAILNTGFANHDYRTNKFCMIALTGGNIGKHEWYPRTHMTIIPNEAADVHQIELDHSTSAITSMQSVPRSGFQRVYFDNATAPLITLRNFMDDIFDFVV